MSRRRHQIPAAEVADPVIDSDMSAIGNDNLDDLPDLSAPTPMAERGRSEPVDDEPEPDLEPKPDPRRREETQRRVNPRAKAARARARGASGDRVPLGVPTLKLSLRDYDGQLDGCVSRWINDTGDRIDQAIRGGYVPIYKHGLEVGEGDDDSYNPDQDTWVSKVVGTHDSGRPLIAYAMKIREEWYRQDQAAKQKSVDAIDDQIKRGLVNQGHDDKRYLKTADYQIGSKN